MQESGYYKVDKLFTVDDFLSKFDKLFVVYRTDNISKASSYLLGLLKYEKNHTNMERMVEQVPEHAYHQNHNFLSESKWDYKLVNDRTALEASCLLEKCNPFFNWFSSGQNKSEIFFDRKSLE